MTDRGGGESEPIWRRWLAETSRASAAYWSIQAGVCLLLFIATAAVVDVPRTATSAAAWPLRPFFEAGIYLLATHVGIRPYLRLRIVDRSPSARDWGMLAGWLAVVSLASLAARLSFDAIVSTEGLAVLAELQGERRESARFPGSGLRQALAGVNLFATHALWAGLYLGVKALITHRKMQSQVESARLAQLGNQLSPHFLFNALNSIRALVFEDPEKAANLITRLAELLRSHLQMDLPSTQTLQEEWELARRYLDIEAVRLEERLTTRVSIDPACLSRRLPSLALLCLVENAIKHGIAPSSVHAVLKVESAVADSGWYLEVRNPWREGQGTAGAGTGLRNLRERLALAFGDRAQMRAARDQDAFSVRLDFQER